MVNEVELFCRGGARKDRGETLPHERVRALYGWRHVTGLA